MIASLVSGLAGGLISSAADAIFGGASRWVADGAVWLLDQVGSVLSSTTSVNLQSPWFGAHEAVMVGISAVVIVPMLCCAAIQAIVRQNASVLLRSFLVNLPLALLLSGVAVELVQLMLSATDALCSAVAGGTGLDLRNLLAPVMAFLGASGPGVPTFVLFMGGLLVAICSFVLWLELVVRAAAVTAAALFLPLVLASLVWPAVAHWCRRLADTLAALVLSKFVIVAILSLGVGALTSGDGFSSVVSGIALLLLATFSPFTLMKLVPAIEAGAVSHLEGTRHRMQQLAQSSARAGGLAIQALGGAVAGGEAAGMVGLGMGGSGGNSGGGGRRDITSILPQVLGVPDPPRSGSGGAGGGVGGAPTPGSGGGGKDGGSGGGRPGSGSAGSGSAGPDGKLRLPAVGAGAGIAGG